MLIPNLHAYYMFYGLQTCLALGFFPPMLGTFIRLVNFKLLWKFDNLKYQEYVAYTITCGYINVNDSHGYRRLKYLTSCYRVYAMHLFLQIGGNLSKILS